MSPGAEAWTFASLITYAFLKPSKCLFVASEWNSQLFHVITDHPVRRRGRTQSAVVVRQQLQLPRGPERHLLRAHDPVLHPIHAVLRQRLQEGQGSASEVRMKEKNHCVCSSLFCSMYVHSTLVLFLGHVHQWEVMYIAASVLQDSF